jgi:hypothetical protein
VGTFFGSAAQFGTKPPEEPQPPRDPVRLEPDGRDHLAGGHVVPRREAGRGHVEHVREFGVGNSQGEPAAHPPIFPSRGAGRTANPCRTARAGG